MKDLVNMHSLEAGGIRVVLDNLNTLAPAALNEISSPEARRIVRKLEFLHTPN